MKRKRLYGRDRTSGCCGCRRQARRWAYPCRRLGISNVTSYNWKDKVGGMDISDAKRLKALEDENVRLKKLLAEQMLDAAALRM